MRADAFRAMGSDAGVYLVGGGPGLVADARARVEDLEAKWSRFLPTSEVSRLNAASGTPRVVSDDTFALIARGMDAWRLTAGRCDPTVLGDVLRAGYTTTFDDLAASTAAATESSLTRGCADVVLDAATRTVQLPSGVGFDPGGIGKGLAADLVVDELLAAGAEGACVNLGGDVRVAGTPPEASWAIAIDHPTRPDPAAVVHLCDGAVATSSRLRRRWAGRHGPTHHLIDPVSGRPADVSLWSATAIAATGWQAEALAKAAFLDGLPAGVTLLEQLRAAGLLIDDDGAVLTTPSFQVFTDPAPSRVATH
jgi:FAD:protein FMN transferase